MAEVLRVRIIDGGGLIYPVHWEVYSREAITNYGRSTSIAEALAAV